MIFPTFLKKQSTIGLCAPSAGAGFYEGGESVDLAIAQLQAHGFQTKETPGVRLAADRGGTASQRGRELTDLFLDPAVDAVLAVSGGDFLFEMLPEIDWNRIRRHPKWMMGASDPTSILFTLTTKYDIATLYGRNAMSFAAEELDSYTEHSLTMLKGKGFTQHSSSMHAEKADFMEDYHGLDTPTVYHASRTNLSLKGRCIGGCLDVLKDLIGTRYDAGKAFSRRYQEDGLLWYFDIFAMSAENMYRTLLQLRYAGWLDHCRGLLFGRVLFPSSETGMSYEEAVRLAAGDLPWVMDMDIGHTNPSFTLINGALLKVQVRSGKGTLTFTCR